MRLLITLLLSNLLAASVAFAGIKEGGGGSEIESAFRIKALLIIDAISRLDAAKKICQPDVLLSSLDSTKIEVVQKILNPVTGQLIEGYDAWTSPGKIQLKESAWKSLFSQVKEEGDQTLDGLILHELYRTTGETCDDDNFRRSGKTMLLLAAKGGVCTPLPPNDLNENCNTHQCYVPRHLEKSKAIAMAGYQACVLTENKQVRCWTFKDHYDDPFWVQAPADLCGVEHIAVTEKAACAAGIMGLRCWGRWMNEANLPKNLGPIKSLVSDNSMICALTDQEVRCWGQEGNENVRYGRTIMKVKSISIAQNKDARYSVCATMDDGNVRCWDGRAEGEFKDPVSPVFGKVKLGAGTCFSTDAGFTYLEDVRMLANPSRETRLFDVGEVKQISTGGWRQTCMITEKKGFGCFYRSSFEYYGPREWPDVPENLGQVSAVSSGFITHCAITDKGVRCWSGQ